MNRWPLFALFAVAVAASVEAASSSALTISNMAQTDQSRSATSTTSNSNASTRPDESLLTLHSTVSEVHVVFTVTDNHGYYVKDLKQEDFEILDDRKPPQEILSFHSETDLPLEIALLVDTSQSVRERFTFEQEAAITFLTETLRRNYDHAYVMGFDITAKVTQDFTDDIEKLAAGIHLLRPSNSITAMYDAVNSAGNKLLKRPETGPVRRLIILLSDGYDNSSLLTRDRVILNAQQAEVSVYTIHSSLKPGGLGQKTLAMIAEATGGRSYVPVQIAGLANSFTAIQEELRSQYAVSYRPMAFRLDGHYRTIEMRTKKRRGLHIHNRKGYRSLAAGHTANP